MSVLQSNIDTDVRILIREHLEKKGIMRKWLADKCECTSSHLKYVFDCERKLTDEMLAKINAALETNFVKNPMRQAG